MRAAWIELFDLLDTLQQGSLELVTKLGLSSTEGGEGDVSVVEEEHVVVQMRPRRLQHRRPALFKV